MVFMWSHSKSLKEFPELVNNGVVGCTLKQTLRLDIEGLKEAFIIIKKKGSIGKTDLKVPEGNKTFM